MEESSGIQILVVWIPRHDRALSTGLVLRTAVIIKDLPLEGLKPALLLMRVVIHIPNY